MSDDLKHFFEKMFVFLSLLSFALGRIPAYFENDFYAELLWPVGSATLKIFLSYVSRNNFSLKLLFQNKNSLFLQRVNCK